MFKILKENRIHYFYEVVLPDIPSHFFIDSDVEIDINPGIDFEKLRNLEIEFLDFVREFYVKCNIISDPSELEIMILDSSINTNEKKKFSRHYIFICEKVFQNMYHCGAFARALQNFIMVEKEKIENPKKSRFWFNKTCKVKNHEEDGKFYCDLAIYTYRRVYRTWNSKKLKKILQNAFRVYPKDEIPDENSFHKFFVQTSVDFEKEIIIFKEWNDEEPKSTSDVTLGRFDKIKNLEKFNVDIKKFYKESFPFEKIWDLFGDPSREFGISSEKTSEKNIWFDRNLYFPDKESFKTYILTSRRNICSIHIGPISLLNNISNKRVPISKEFILDIDIKDYIDESIGKLKTCCESESVCKNCWVIMKLSMTIIDIIYSKCLGIENYSFYFSGKKGFHAWIFEKKYRSLENDVKKNLVSLLSFENLNQDSPIYKILMKSSEIIKVLNEMRLNKFLVEMEDLSDLEILNIYKIRIDKAPLFQLNHLIKSPHTLHSVSKKVCIELKRENNFDYPFQCK
jgi:DNA primase catalytic subunit